MNYSSKSFRMWWRGRRVAAGLIFAGALLLAGRAHAKPEFPPDIATHLSASIAPACSVCHLEGKTNGVTVVTPFAFALRAHGFTNSETSLNSALDQMAADGTDTDGDGVSDVDELRAGTDPDSPVPGAPSADPTYGCGVAPRSGGAGWAAAALLAGAAIFLRRARRR